MSLDKKSPRRSIFLNRRLGAGKLLLAALLTIGALSAPALLSASPALAAGTGSTLQPGQTLTGGQSVTSPNGEFTLRMQTDGNLVLYRFSGNVTPNVPLWYTGMFTKNSPGAFVAMQTDGNLVLYSSSHQWLWQSGTGGHVGLGSYLTVQNDGNLVIRTAGGSVLWNAASNLRNTTLQPGDYLKPGWQLESSDGRYDLSMQADGNLVIYRIGTSSYVWTSATHNNSGAGQNYVWMRPDGNLVVWNAYYQEEEWASGTSNHPGATAAVTAGWGSLQVLLSGTQLWQSVQLWPSWWRPSPWTVCDTGHDYGSSPLGPPTPFWSPAHGQEFELFACGPNNDVSTSFGQGVNVLEWECVELSMRYLYLAYGIAPYGSYSGNPYGANIPTNGWAVVWNYPGTLLRKIRNGTVGSAPQIGDVLSYGTSAPGHTSVVVATHYPSAGNGSITVIQQNAGSAYATLTVSNWSVSAGSGYPSPVTGWLHHP